MKPTCYETKVGEFLTNINKELNGDILNLTVVLKAGKKSYFAPLPFIITKDTKVNYSISGGTPDFWAFYNEPMNNRTDALTQAGELRFGLDCYYVRVEMNTAQSEDINFVVYLKSPNCIKSNISNVDEKIKTISNIAKYQNVDFDSIEKELGSFSNKTYTVWNCDQYNRYHKTIATNGANYVKVKANNSLDTKVIIMKTNTTAVHLEKIDNAYGWDGWKQITSGTEEIFKIPTDGNYIAIEVNSNSADETPQFMELYFENIPEYELCKKIRMFPKTSLPAIAFNFDDIHENDELIVNLFLSKGLTCGFAFYTTDEKIRKYSDKYLEYQNKGFDILNHSNDVNSLIERNYTFEQAKVNIVSALNKLQNIGFIVNGFVCPNSEISDSFKSIVDKTHAYNFVGAHGGIYGSNSRDADVGDLLRYSLESNTTSDIKTYIDDCIANDKLLLFYAHTTRLGNNIGGEVFNLAKIEEILDYCIMKRNNLECYLGSSDDVIRYYFNL